MENILGAFCRTNGQNEVLVRPMMLSFFAPSAAMLLFRININPDCRGNGAQAINKIRLAG